jgi:hypothetical protein
MEFTGALRYLEAGNYTESDASRTAQSFGRQLGCVRRSRADCVGLEAASL